MIGGSRRERRDNKGAHLDIGDEEEKKGKEVAGERGENEGAYLDIGNEGGRARLERLLKARAERLRQHCLGVRPRVPRSEFLHPHLLSGGCSHVPKQLWGHGAT